MKALIAGGGIGGLSSALFLLKSGWQVELHEKADALGEAGAGIQLSPNACHLMGVLGLLEKLRALAFEPEQIEMRIGRSGRHVFSVPLRAMAEKRWGACYLHLHRADLLSVLQTALEARTGFKLHLNSALSSYTQNPEGVTANFTNGDTRHAELLIGADGIHSVVREQMLGKQAPRFTGNLAWRAVVPVRELGENCPPPSACIWTGSGRHAVTYLLRSGTLANFVGVVEQGDWLSESWTEQGTREQALADFHGFHPIITTIIAKASRHYRWALFDREPLPRWTEGRVALLGDACHPMLPFLAQGAAQAIEDAAALARNVRPSLDGNGEIQAALTSYYRERIARTSRVQAGARANMRRFHHRDAAYLPLALLARLTPGLIHAQQDWLYGYQPPAA